MPDYSPLYLPGHEFTSTASAAITGGQLVAVSGSDTVAPAAAGSNAFVGVAAFDAALNGLVTVFGRGPIHISTASGAITAGDRVNSGAAGTVATGAAALTNIGVALTTAADGAQVTWMEI
jgi:hypothetical protein